MVKFIYAPSNPNIFQQEDFDINKYYYNREGVITSDQMQPHMHGENRGYNGYMQQGGPNYSMHGQQQCRILSLHTDIAKFGTTAHLMSQQRPGMPPMVCFYAQVIVVF